MPDWSLGQDNIMDLVRPILKGLAISVMLICLVWWMFW